MQLISGIWSTRAPNGKSTSRGPQKTLDQANRDQEPVGVGHEMILYGEWPFLTIWGRLGPPRQGHTRSIRGCETAADKRHTRSSGPKLCGFEGLM